MEPRFATSLVQAALVATIILATPKSVRATDLCAPAFLEAKTADAYLERAASNPTHDQETAKAAYRLAEQHLEKAPWSTSLRHCDPANYSFYRLSVEMHYVAVGLRLGERTIANSEKLSNELWSSFFVPRNSDPSTDVDVESYYSEHYPDLWKRVLGYAAQIREAYRVETIAKHNPRDLHCANPNVPPEVLDAVLPVAPFDQNVRDLKTRDFKVKVDVQLSEKGDVLGTSLSVPSGSEKYDASALRAARESHYLPRIESCRPVTSTFAFTAGMRIIYKP